MLTKKHFTTAIRGAALILILLAGFGCAAKDADHTLTELDDGASGLTALQHESLADTAFKGGNLKLAYTHYAQAIRMEPEDMNLHLKQGVLLLTEHQDDMALEEFQAVLSRDPDNGIANEGAGTVYFRSGLDQEAEASFERALAASPDLWMSLNYLGVLHGRKGNYARSAESLRQALAVNPHSDEALNNLGLTLTMSGDYQGAVDAFGEALRMGASEPKTYNNLGLVLARMGKYDKALQAFRMAGDEARAYNNLGYVLLLEGKPAQAAECFEKAISLSPTFYVKASENLARARRAATFRDIDGRTEERVAPLTGTLMPLVPAVASVPVAPTVAPTVAPATVVPASVVPASVTPVSRPGVETVFPEPSSRKSAGAVPAILPAAFGGRRENVPSAMALGTDVPPPASGAGPERISGPVVDVTADPESARDSGAVVEVRPNQEPALESSASESPAPESLAPESAGEPDSPVGPQAALARPSEARWGVHVSSWRKEAKAERQAEKLRERGLPAHVDRKDLAGRGVWYRVIAGEFTSFAAAEDRKPRIMETLHLSTAFVRKYYVPASAPELRDA